MIWFSLDIMTSYILHRNSISSNFLSLCHDVNLDLEVGGGGGGGG